MFYGPPTSNSLHLLKHYFTANPEDASRVVLSMKGAYNGATHVPDCRPESIRAAVDEALNVLAGTKSIDLFSCARVDPKVPIETSVATLVELIKEGKIGSYGLSEVNPATIRRAHAVHPVAAVEIELSLFSREAIDKGGVTETCHELGIPVVSYSPLDRGWLTGQLKTRADLPEGDYRHHLPRFQPGAFEKNVKLAETVEKVAQAKGCTAPQVAIAWARQQGTLPIPGVTKLDKVVENCKAVTLNETELAELQKGLDGTEVVGHRYAEIFHAHLNG